MKTWNSSGPNKKKFRVIAPFHLQYSESNGANIINYDVHVGDYIYGWYVIDQNTNSIMVQFDMPTTFGGTNFTLMPGYFREVHPIISVFHPLFLIK